MGAAGQVSLQSEPRVSRIFISYASQDLPIALAIANAFGIALGDGFAEINIDKWFLQAGDEFNKQIELKLDKTDIFVIVYTGAEKRSHSFSGSEVSVEQFREVGQNQHHDRGVPAERNRAKKSPRAAYSVQRRHRANGATSAGSGGFPQRNGGARSPDQQRAHSGDGGKAPEHGQ